MLVTAFIVAEAIPDSNPILTLFDPLKLVEITPERVPIHTFEPPVVYPTPD
jgi:hypothetical protein